MPVGGTENTVEVQRVVAFGDCDPAGIAYTGKIVDYALQAIDAFWNVVLEGKGWFELNLDYNIGTPFVQINIGFSGPITPRQPLFLRVQLVRRGTTSVVLQVTGVQRGEDVFCGTFTCVFVERSSLRKIQPPAWIAQAIDRFSMSG